MDAGCIEPSYSRITHEVPFMRDYRNLGTKEQRGPLRITSQFALLELSNNRHVLKRYLAVDNDAGSLLWSSSWTYKRSMSIYMDIELTLTTCYRDGFKDE